MGKKGRGRKRREAKDARRHLPSFRGSLTTHTGLTERLAPECRGWNNVEEMFSQVE